MIFRNYVNLPAGIYLLSLTTLSETIWLQRESPNNNLCSDETQVYKITCNHQYYITIYKWVTQLLLPNGRFAALESTHDYVLPPRAGLF